MSLRVEGVSKRFGKKEVLKNVNVDVESGSIFCILGPPGAGKTTLFYVIAGLIEPDKGKIYLDGCDITEVPPERRKISMVFQNYALYPTKTVYENIANPLRIRKMRKDEIDKRVKEVADLLWIGELLDRKPRELSGGEAQRVAIARALAPEDNKVVLLDEPFINLDYKIREELRVRFKEILKKLNRTFIFASPDPFDALAMADYVAVMYNGVVCAQGKVSEIYSRPPDPFASLYFGRPLRNSIEASLVEKEGKTFLDAGIFVVDVSPLRAKFAGAGKEFILYVKPEDLRLNEKVEKGAVMFEAKILACEPSSETLLALEVDNVVLYALLPGFQQFVEGTKVKVSFDIKKVNIYSKQLGKMIT
ncbi:MAG: ABC transporter ATP-binding protein [Candidatus Bathyarchaeia archaeon]